MANKERTNGDRFPSGTKAGVNKAMAAAGITVVPFGPAEDEAVELQQNESVTGRRTKK